MISLNSLNKEGETQYKPSDIYVDAHCHLVDVKPRDFEQLLLDKTPILPVNSAYSYETSKKVFEISEKYGPFPNVVGLSPHKAQDLRLEEEAVKNGTYNKWKSLFEENMQTINGIGEIGLDYHWGNIEIQRKRQKIGFELMIKLAKKFDKPIIIHARESLDDVIRMLETFDVKRVMFHFYSGGPKEAEIVRDAGWFISVPPLRSKKRKKSIVKAGIEHIMSETDSPYVGKTINDVIKSVKYISDTLHLDETETKSAIFKNALTFFNIRTHTRGL